MNDKAIKKATNGSFDLLKFVLSIFVVAIHSSLLPNVVYPWVRLAVPLFFILTSYFFFGKVFKMDDKTEKLKALRGFISRNLILYLFWFVALLPITLYIRRYFNAGIIDGIVQLVKGFFFGSTFVASWYIMASIIGTVIIFFASKKFGNKTLLAITSVIYLMVCVRSAYWSLLEDVSWIESVREGYESIFTSPANSFPVSLFWICLGKCFAEGTFDFKFKSIKLAVLIIASAVLLYAEWLLVKHICGSVNKDCYIFLAPLAVLIFTAIKNAKPLEIKWSRELRFSSTIIYASHGSVLTVVTIALTKILGSAPKGLLFLMILFACLAISAVIMFLEKKKIFKWLKYSH